MKLREIENRSNLIDMLEKSLPIIMKELKLPQLPKIKLVKQVDDKQQPTFGRYENDKKIIHLGIANRHPIDIIRTLAHELAHYKQDLEGRLGPHSGETGSPEENQAHVLAGIIMRHIDKKYPEFLRADNVELP